MRSPPIHYDHFMLLASQRSPRIDKELVQHYEPPAVCVAQAMDVSLSPTIISESTFNLIFAPTVDTTLSKTVGWTPSLAQW